MRPLHQWASTGTRDQALQDEELRRTDPATIHGTDAKIALARAGAHHCFQRGLGQDINLEGKALFRFEVGSTGAVSQVYVNSIGLTAEMTTCIRDVLAGLVLDPPVGGAATVSDSFTFINATRSR